MKKVFIPQGTVEKYENLYADELVVKGLLIVTGIIRAKKIYGNGTIKAARVIANIIVTDTLEAEYICAKRLIASKVFCLTANVSVGIIAKDYIQAQKVKTTQLTAALSQIDSTEANEIIRLTPKKSFARTLFCSWIQVRFAVWRHNRIVNPVAETDAAMKGSADAAFDKLVDEYKKKYRKGGYRLVLEAVEADAV